MPSPQKKYTTLVSNTLLFAISNFSSKLLSFFIRPYLSYALDSPDVPDAVRDYVVYHECLHLRQGYRPGGCTHDPEFRRWEHSYPGWKECEIALRTLHRRTGS